MALINNVTEVLHRIRVKLYPSYLNTVQGEYIAQTNSEASLSIEEICAALKNRGGYTGNYNDVVEHVKQFFDELVYQLCDGFTVNTGYFSIHPNVGGTFDKVTEGHDEQKHPVTFRFRTLAQLRALAEHIVIDVEGLADVQGYIDEFTDVTTASVNESADEDDDGLGGIFSLSYFNVANNIINNLTSNQYYTIQEIFDLAADRMNKDYPLADQNPVMKPERRNHFFPFVV
jgi:hypothetical protein